MTRDPLEAAIAAGIGYLENVQGDNGEFPTVAAYSHDMTVQRKDDPCFFGTVAVASTLIDVPESARLCDAACDYIERQTSGGDLWMYYNLGHFGVYPPPDVDDSSLAGIALRGAGRRTVDNRRALLANRDRQGMFLTWFMPVQWPVRLALLKANWRQAFRLRRYVNFFRTTMCEVADVDAGVNANVLTWLGRFDGDEKVIDRFLDILREGREDSCDKYYDDPVLIRYFFSRALVGRSDEAGALLVKRAEVADDAPPLHLALVILIRAIWNAPLAPTLADRLISAQGTDGSWPIAPLYIAGRDRLGYCRFAPTHPDMFRVGSESMVTAFCIAALKAVQRAAG